MKKGLLVVLLLFLITVTSAFAAVTVTSPKFGVSQELTFDLVVGTGSAVACRFSTTFAKPYAEMDDFTSTGGTTHTLQGVVLPAAGTDYDYFINCSAGAEAANIKLKADTANPSIVSAVANPNKVVDTPLETTLAVTTNELTSCKYDETANKYDEMTELFSGSDSNKDNYLTSHEKLLSTELSDDTDYSFNVMCRDISGRDSTLATISFKVNTSTEPVIINFTPADNSFTSQENVVLTITTNKNSVCKFGSESPPTEESGNFNVQGTVHEATVQVSEDAHTYYFKCVFEGPKELTAQTTFTVDKSKPLMLLVDDDQKLGDAPEDYTYYTNRLKAEWEAEDNESGIKEYNYTIMSGNRIIVNWTTTEADSVTVRDLELEDGKEYFFRVMARNRAGLWSEAEDSDGVRIDISLNVEQACKNDKLDGDESDVDCGGSCRACSLERMCVSNSDCKSGFCSEGICARGSCDDGEKNQDETDVDCGGSCGACLLGDTCKDNDDCKTGVCTEEICISKGQCFNGELDASESDVDCGGICADLKSITCAVGKTCTEDTDCRTQTCGVDGKCSLRNDRDYDKILDNDDNCPKVYNPKQEDVENDGVGDKCDDDSDNDGMTDVWEEQYGLNIYNANDAGLDNDEDTLTNLKEFELGTNPLLIDTDGDGHSDAKEVAKGTNPNDPQSKPRASRLIVLAVWMLIFLAIFVGIGFFYYRKLTAPVRETKKQLERRKADDTAPPEQQKLAQPEERKYRPAPIYRPSQPPPPPRRHAIRDIDEIRERHADISGEEVFDRLKRHTRRRKSL